MLLVSLGSLWRASFWAMMRLTLLRQRLVMKRTRLACKSVMPSGGGGGEYLLQAEAGKPPLAVKGLFIGPAGVVGFAEGVAYA